MLTSRACIVQPLKCLPTEIYLFYFLFALDNIYICGGFDGQEILRSAEYYNPNLNQWTMVAPMESIRSGFCVVAYRESIYALGGFDGNNRMSTVERYIPSNDVWRPAPSLGVARSNFAAEVSLHNYAVIRTHTHIHINQKQ